MAEKGPFSVGNGKSTMAQSVQSGLAAHSAGAHSVLQDGLSFTPLDSNSDRVVQPFPRSPKLQRKQAKAAKPSQVNMSVVRDTGWNTFTGLICTDPTSEMTSCSKNFM